MRRLSPTDNLILIVCLFLEGSAFFLIECLCEVYLDMRRNWINQNNNNYKAI